MAWPSDGSYTSWTNQFKVTSQASKISAALDWYFLDLSLMPADFWSNVQADGDDLRFTEDDGETAVYHRLIYIDTGTETGLVAIAQPHGTGGASADVDTYCYVGNAGASSTASTSAFPSTLEALYMLQEAPTSSTAVLDWTANARHSTAIAGAMTSGDLIAGGGPHSGLDCINFDGNDRITIPSTLFDACESANAYTWFGWLKLSSISADRGAFGAAGTQFHVRYDSIVDGYAVTQRNSANSASFSVDYNSAPGTTGWYQVCAVYNGSTLKLYIDGAEVGSVSATSIRSATLGFFIGHDNSSYWRGDLAEIGIYSSAFSANQVATFYANEKDIGFWVVDGGGTGVAGDGALTLPAPLTLSGSGQVLIGGSGAAALPLLSMSGAGTVLVSGSGALTLPSPLALDGEGSAPAGGSGNCGFPQLVLAGAGRTLVGGSGNLNLTKLRTSGSGSPVVRGSGNLDLPALELAGSNEPPVTTTGWFLFSFAESGPAQLPTTRAWYTPEAALDESLSSALFSTVPAGPNTIFSAELRVRNPVGLDIPSGSEITDIWYKVSRQGPTRDLLSVFDYEIFPIKGGASTGDDLSSDEEWSHEVGPEESVYGGGLLGLDWGAEDFGSDFGLAIRVRATKEILIAPEARIYTVWGKVDFVSTNPISGSGAIDLPLFTMDSPPIPSTGAGSLTLPALSMKAHSYNALCSCCEGYTMRTLLELRRMLVQQSGHLELVLDAEQEDWGDNGADVFIQAGQRFCDDQWQHHKSEAWLYVKMASGESLATFTNARIIKEVWLNKANGPRTLVKRLTLNDIRERYTEAALADETTGTPLYWAPAVLGLAPQQFEETALTFEADGITDYDLIMFGNHYPYKGIYVMPPCDGDYTLEIKAEWQSHEMCDDADVSFWSQYPELLLMAARREMEIHLHRNTTGAQDFERPLLHSLQKLYHNLIAEESSGPTKIRRG